MLSRLTPRWSARVSDKVPSSHLGARGAQLDSKDSPTLSRMAGSSAGSLRDADSPGGITLRCAC